MSGTAAAAPVASTSTAPATVPAVPAPGSAASLIKKTGGQKKGLIRTRGKRGGAKNRKSDSKSSIVGGKQGGEKGEKSSKGKKKAEGVEGNAQASSSTKAKGKASDVLPSEHSLSIGAFHMLEKKIARESDPVQKALLIKKRNESGGLEAYQLASQKGAELGESGKWCAESLMELEKEREEVSVFDLGEGGKEECKGLDQGSFARARQFTIESL